MKRSRVLEVLNSGGLVRMVKLSRVIEPWLTEVVSQRGFDAIWLDLEHRTFAEDIMYSMALATRVYGSDLVVRVRKTGYDMPMRALEAGAAGIMVPHCSTAECASQWVRWCKFPPLGDRGFDGVGADANHSMCNPKEYLAHANQQTFVMLQIEDAEALENVDEIAAVEGVDLLFLGLGDLTVSMGIPFQFDHPDVRDAAARVAAAAARHGKWWGLSNSSPAAAQKAVDLGARLIICGSDHQWLMRGSEQALADYSAVRLPELVQPTR